MLNASLTKSVLKSVSSRSVVNNLRPAAARGYHEKVIQHYEKPRNVRVCSSFDVEGSFFVALSDSEPALFFSLQVGSLPKGDSDVGTGLVGAPA